MGILQYNVSVIKEANTKVNEHRERERAFGFDAGA